jgi:hypothetical protein
MSALGQNMCWCDACRLGARTLALGRQIVRKPNFVIPDNQRLAVGEQVSMPKSA